MIVIFKEKYLRDLYETGKTADKEHRFHPEIIRKYKQCISLMRCVSDTDVLAKYNGLNFETLRGDKSGISSVRIDRQYRIEMTVTDNGIESVAEICAIIDLSKYYK
jgi:proteic killer suppression protein